MATNHWDAHSCKKQSATFFNTPSHFPHPPSRVVELFLHPPRRRRQGLRDDFWSGGSWWVLALSTDDIMTPPLQKTSKVLSIVYNEYCTLSIKVRKCWVSARSAENFFVGPQTFWLGPPILGGAKLVFFGPTFLLDPLTEWGQTKLWVTKIFK